MLKYIILLALLFSVLNNKAYASEIGDEFIFKRIALFELEDNTAEGYGRIVSRSLRGNIADLMRFDIAIPEEEKIPPSRKEAIRISKKLKADAAIYGSSKIEGGILKISLEIINVKNGNTFATESKWIKGKPTEEIIEKNIKELTARLMSRMPYKALVTEVREDGIIINAGEFHGIEKGASLSVFEIKGIKRHPFTNEIISFEKDVIGELTVVKSEGAAAAAKIKEVKKGKTVAVNNKIDFKPSLKAIAASVQRKREFLAMKEKEAEKEKVKKKEKPEERNYNIVGIDAIVGYATNDYSFNSNELKFTRKANAFFTAGVKGELWPVSFLGVDASYKTAWLKFDKIGATSIDTNATPYWFSANLKYRYIFTNKPTSPHLIGKAGYYIYNFSVDKSDNLYFNNYSYSGISIGLGAKVPFWDSFGINISGDYLPSLSVTESPVSSGGSGAASGYLIGVGMYYILIDGFMLDLNYNYNSYSATFTGAGTRGTGTTSASSTDTYNGVNLNIRYEF